MNLATYRSGNYGSSNTRLCIVSIISFSEGKSITLKMCGVYSVPNQSRLVFATWNAQKSGETWVLNSESLYY